MLDVYMERIEAENRELRTLLSLGDGWPEAMRQREQGARDLAECLATRGSEAEWELTEPCQLPAECVIKSSHQVSIDSACDSRIIVDPFWMDRERKIHATRVRHAFAPNQHMKPANEAAKSIHEAWLRTQIKVDRALFIRSESSTIDAAPLRLAHAPISCFSRLSELMKAGIAPVMEYWRGIVTWARMTRRSWTLYDHPHSHLARRKPLYVKLLLVV